MNSGGAGGLGTVKALYDYDPTDEGELAFKEDDILTVLEKNPDGWWFGEHNGVQGLFPSNFVVDMIVPGVSQSVNHQLAAVFQRHGNKVSWVQLQKEMVPEKGLLKKMRKSPHLQAFDMGKKTEHFKLKSGNGAIPNATKSKVKTESKTSEPQEQQQQPTVNRERLAEFQSMFPSFSTNEIIHLAALFEKHGNQVTWSQIQSGMKSKIPKGMLITLRESPYVLAFTQGLKEHFVLLTTSSKAPEQPSPNRTRPVVDQEVVRKNETVNEPILLQPAASASASNELLFSTATTVATEAASSIKCEVHLVNEVGYLLGIMPNVIRARILDYADADPDFILNDITEITMDLSRPYEIYFLNQKRQSFSLQIVTREDIDHVVAQLDFGSDGRSGIEGTLHRISRIANRYGDVVGLTLRVGRAALGVASRLQDITSNTESILLIGSPATGKTTIMRDIARVMADTNRVIIVDTSCEIGGFGDAPHVAIGRARVMQVPNIGAQQQIMLQAVQNHSPDVIVIDEIGTIQEVYTARTISQRGVVLCASAHGSMQSIMKNPILCNLLGGVETVLVGDKMASQLNNQKVHLQMKETPIFDTVIELSKDDMHSWRVYRDVGTVVKKVLAKEPYQYELRTFDPTTQQMTKTMVTHDPTVARLP